MKRFTLATATPMHQQTIQQIVAEIGPLLADRFLGKIYQLDPTSVAIDFGLRGRYLFISVNPASPRLYLIRRRTKDLEKNSIQLSQFAQTLRAQLSGARVLTTTIDPSERVARFSFATRDEAGEPRELSLVAQLTGRSANLFLLESSGNITHALRAPKGRGQSVGEHYRPPESRANIPQEGSQVQKGAFESLSAAADDHYLRLEAERAFQAKVNTMRSRLRKQITVRAKLKSNLKSDLAAHGDPEQHRRLGELLLANVATAQRNSTGVVINDYYSEGAPTIELELDEGVPLQKEAARFFGRYSKAKRAKEGIAKRLLQIDRELAELKDQQAKLEQIVADHDDAALTTFARAPADAKQTRKKQTEATKIPGVRRYRSSDGYEILVGRAARDNDHLTFRVARPNDLWLHAADYPGSHVVIRNASRGEIPHRTIIEAAQLAARFSQASNDSKVVVHYSQRKFLAKPKGAAPGLVRMSSVRTITVEPREDVKRWT